MTSISTSRLIDVYNQALRFVGQRPFELTEPDVNSRKVARDCVTHALFTLEHSFDWPSQLRTANALSWSGADALLQSFTKLVSAEYRWDSGYAAPMLPVHLEDLRIRTPQAMLDTPGIYGLVFAQKNYQTVTVSPYPTTPEQTSRVFFSYYKTFTRPATDTTLFDMPEEMIPLLVTQVCVQLCEKLIADTAQWQTFNATFERDLRTAISHSQALVPSQKNMFRRTLYGQRILW